MCVSRLVFGFVGLGSFMDACGIVLGYPGHRPLVVSHCFGVYAQAFYDEVSILADVAGTGLQKESEFA